MLMNKHVVRMRAGILLAALALAATAQSDLHFDQLPNLYKVNQQLYRGGQPKSGGLLKLKELGVKTVVNLRGEDDQSRAEAKEAASLGLKYYGISLPGFSKPTDEDVQHVLDIINSSGNHPWFVHCHHGSDH